MRRRRRNLKIAACLFAFVYIASYVTLSRVGMAISEDAMGVRDIYYYIPVRHFDGKRLVYTNAVLVVVFYPVWVVDHFCFGTPPPGFSVPFWGP